jgi:hypothetical protein
MVAVSWIALLLKINSISSTYSEKMLWDPHFSILDMVEPMETSIS